MYLSYVKLIIRVFLVSGIIATLLSGHLQSIKQNHSVRASSSPRYELGFPWKVGETWKYTGDRHGTGYYGHSYDFAPTNGSQGTVYSMHKGIVKSVPTDDGCIEIYINDGPDSIFYLHITRGKNPETNQDWEVGNEVDYQTPLGKTINYSTSGGCSGTTDNHHVHVDFSFDPVDTVTFGGWTPTKYEDVTETGPNPDPDRDPNWGYDFPLKKGGTVLCTEGGSTVIENGGQSICSKSSKLNFEGTLPPHNPEFNYFVAQSTGVDGPLAARETPDGTEKARIKSQSAGMVLATQDDWWRVQWVDGSLTDHKNGGSDNFPYWSAEKFQSSTYLVEYLNLPFPDIPENHVFFDSIAIAYEGGIFQGYGNGNFGPDDNLLREQYALVITRWLNGNGKIPDISEIKIRLNYYHDVAPPESNDNKVEIAILWLTQEGYIDGTNCDHNPDLNCFKPTNPITRGEFVKMTVNVLTTHSSIAQHITQNQLWTPCLVNFSDITGHTHEDDIKIGCKLGLFKGYGDGTFGPDNLIKRGEAAKIASRAYLLAVDPPVILAGQRNLHTTLSEEFDESSFEYFIASDELLALRWLAHSRLIGGSVCKLYSIHDEGTKDSQFFDIDFSTLEESTNSFSGLYEGTDIEAVEVSPDSQLMYTVASYQGTRTSELYLVNPDTGELFLVGEIVDEDGKGFKEVDSLSFHPDGTLWGFARWGSQRGIIRINPDTAIAELLAVSYRSLQGIAWQPNGETLWLAGDNKKLYAYTPGNPITFMYNLAVPDRIESMEFRPDGLLWIGVHHGGAINIFTFDVETGRFIASDSLSTNEFQDVEGLAWPEWCTEEFPSFTEIKAETGGIVPALDSKTEVTLLSQTTDEDTTFGLTRINVSESTPDGMIYANHAFRLNAYQNGQMVENFAFNQPVSVTVYYSNNDVSGIDEETLQLYYWDRNNSVWLDASCGEYEQNLNDNEVVMPICHLTEFALFGQPVKQTPIYLPLILTQRVVL